MTAWPIEWPKDAIPEDPHQKALAEMYAASTLRMLSLYRVGGEPITVIPATRHCALPRFEAPVYPSSTMLRRHCTCSRDCICAGYNRVELEAPIGRVDLVTVDGVEVPKSAFHIEDGRFLVRIDGMVWPSCHERLRVTYLNAYPVDIMGAHIGGLLAAEFIKALRGDKRCKLPDGVKTVTRGGISIELNSELFAGGATGITEVDAWLMQWNPHGLRTAPAVYSIDRPRQRTIRSL